MYVINADIVVIGDAGTGKTSLMLRFVEAKFFANHASTCIDFKSRTLTLGNKMLRYKIWDTAGSEKFRAPMRHYYRKASGVIVVYDITSRASFKSLPSWMDEIADYCHSRDPVLLLCGVKLDEERNREVTDTEGLMFAAKHKMLFCETSAKTGTNVDFCFLQLGAKILEQPRLCTNVTAETTDLHSERREVNCCE